MGPNGSGKSTLSYVLSGREGYEVTGGSATFDGHDLLEMEPEAARRGRAVPRLPVPGRAARRRQRQLPAHRAQRQARARGEPELDAIKFLRVAREAMKRLAMPDDMLKRNVNVGFSGGEKKRNEVLQMAVLRPSSPSWTRPIAAWTSTRSRSWPTASTRCAARTSPPW